MGRSKDFQVLFQDLVAKYKSMSEAEKEYKTYMALAKEQKLDKNAKLSDISMTNAKLSDISMTSAAGGVSSSEKELYERQVEAEHLRAQAEKQRGDDLSKIAMMLASGKGGAQVGPAEDVIPPSPAAAAGVLDDNQEHSKTPSNDNDKEDNEEHTQQGTQNTMTTARPPAMTMTRRTTRSTCDRGVGWGCPSVHVGDAALEGLCLSVTVWARVCACTTQSTCWCRSISGAFSDLGSALQI